MACIKCGRIIEDSCISQLVAQKYEVPFVCTVCGGVYTKYKAVGSRVFIWPKPIAELQGKIFIPEVSRHHFKASIGVILSSGRGCVRKTTGKFVASWVKPGDVVLYDKTVPESWQQTFDATDGKEYTIDQCNILDVLPINNVDSEV